MDFLWKNIVWLMSFCIIILSCNENHKDTNEQKNTKKVPLKDTTSSIVEESIVNSIILPIPSKEKISIKKEQNNISKKSPCKIEKRNDVAIKIAPIEKYQKGMFYEEFDNNASAKEVAKETIKSFLLGWENELATTPESVGKVTQSLLLEIFEIRITKLFFNSPRFIEYCIYTFSRSSRVSDFFIRWNLKP